MDSNNLDRILSINCQMSTINIMSGQLPAIYKVRSEDFSPDSVKDSHSSLQTIFMMVI
jgi:hypothetical protein